MGSPPFDWVKGRTRLFPSPLVIAEGAGFADTEGVSFAEAEGAGFAEAKGYHQR